MKKSLLKNNFREISKNKRRFISMLVMAFLGVGFFAGLVATSPDMLDSLDKYADKSNFYDINIISTLGITDDDIQAIKNIDGVENAYGIQTKDSMVKIDDKEFVRIEAMICSMTKAERKNPKLLNGSRRVRIAKGSGTSVQEINKFMKSFEMTQKMMKQMQSNKGGIKKMMKNIDTKNFKF